MNSLAGAEPVQCSDLLSTTNYETCKTAGCERVRNRLCRNDGRGACHLPNGSGRVDE